MYHIFQALCSLKEKDYKCIFMSFIGKNKQDYLDDIRSGKELDGRKQLFIIVQLSLPAIFAQITTILMEYIDAAMVGRLGEKQSAAIGLVSTSTWLLSGLSYAFGAGFNVQVAHAIGAGREEDARRITRTGMFFGLLFGFLLLVLSSPIFMKLPYWLGGSKEICQDAGLYFLIYALNMPLYQLKNMSAGFLQCSGNMKIPSVLHILMCILDVIFNFLFIFPTRTIILFNREVVVYGLGLGVVGAGIGTALSVIVVSLLLQYFLIFQSKLLRFRKSEKLCIIKSDLIKAMKISLPLGLEQLIMCGAYIASTTIVAPLGSVAIAAHSFAITAESLCYMPGYGVGQAATTIVGQSVGAGRHNLAKRLGWLTIVVGSIMMAISGIIMYIICPVVMGLLTPVNAVRNLAVKVLRIELFAEPLYGASIVANGVFRGAGDTRIPCILNFLSMWMVRIPLSAYLAASYSLEGVWLAMCIELCFRGAVYLLRMASRKTLTVRG